MHEEEVVLTSLPGNTLGPCSSTFFVMDKVATANETHASRYGQSSGSNDCSPTLVTLPPIVPECDVAFMNTSPFPVKRDCSTASGSSACNARVANDLDEFSVPDCDFAFEDLSVQPLVKKDCRIVLNEPPSADGNSEQCFIFDNKTEPPSGDVNNERCFIFDDKALKEPCVFDVRGPADVDLIKSASRDCADTFINQHRTNTTESVTDQIGSNSLAPVSSVRTSVCDVSSNTVLVEGDSQVEGTSAQVGPRGLALLAA